MSRIETVNPQRERWLQVGRRAVWRVAGGLLVLWA
ncbi:ABC transporter permease, partial [Pseudomonas sp. FSL R10-1350]|nr:ABC transporter permease [Pseudomonas helleri]MQU66119.1 ABC transporter permease [Pseudomonas sp. FSL R10-1350]